MTTAPAQTQDDTTWEKLIQEQADAVHPTGYMKSGDILNGGDSDTPGQMRISDMRFKGYTEIFDTKTGVKSLQPWWLLWQTMRMKHTDGTQMYQRTDPHIPRDDGADLFCPLNPSAPEEQRFMGRGFATCTKKHIPHEDALARHIQFKHPRAHRAMDSILAEKRRLEDRALQIEAIQAQRESITAMTAALAQRGAPVATRERATLTKQCPDCDFVAESTLQMALNGKMKAHQKTHAG